MLEDSVCWQPHAETFANGEVDVFSRCNSLGDYVDRLADHSLLNPIAELAGPVFFYDDWHLAASQQEIANILGSFERRSFPANNFDQRHEMGRVPEVSREHPLWMMSALGCDCGDAQAGRVAAKNRVRGGDFV